MRLLSSALGPLRHPPLLCRCATALTPPRRVFCGKGSRRRTRLCGAELGKEGREDKRHGQGERREGR
eukprot:1306919-Rhodomonas_salina.1